jgi:2-furoate---CoA ligase
MQTAYDFVYLAAQRAPDRLAIADDASDRSLTYAALLEEIDAIAAGFAAQGIAPGDIVATCLPNLYDHGLALLGLARLGAIPAMINARLKPQDAGRLIEQGKMKGALVLSDPAFVGAARDALPKGAPVLTTGKAIDGGFCFDDCRGPASGLAPVRRPDPEETAFVFYTSGTTGLPKGVEIPHRATDARMLYMAVQCGLTHGPHNRVLGLMPLFHVVGFYSVFLAALGLDGTYYPVTAFDPAAANESVAEKDITVLYATPTHFHAMLAAPNFAPEKWASVTHLIYAGSAMPGPLLERVRAVTEAKMTNIYGTTEIMNALYMPDPVGRPHTYRPGFYANVRVGKFGGSVHDEAGVGEDGELLSDASADATFTRYLHRPEATAEKLIDGWYRTGDIAVKRADGDLDVKGRVDDMILSGGENIYPEEVEALLVKHESVTECSVIGLPDERWGEVVVACIVGPDADEATLDAHLRASTLANYKRPRRYLFLDQLPKNAAGKVLRRILRDEADQAQDRKVAG